MNQTPLWKLLLVAIATVMGLIYALPNLYGEDPAVQVSSRTVALEELQPQSLEALRVAGLAPARTEIEDGRLVLRFADTEQQLKALDVVRNGLPQGTGVALNLVPATPDWLRSLNALPMYLGLDLRGGVHFLMQVDMVAAVAKAEERYVSDLRTELRKEKVRYLAMGRGQEGGIELRFGDADERTAAIAVIDAQFERLLQRESNDGTMLYLSLGEAEQEEVRKFALQQNLTTLRNRVNELGVAEPVIQQQGKDRIVVQLPGVQDTARAKDILGATATLEFRLVSEGHDAAAAASSGRVPPTAVLYRERNGAPVLLQRRVLLTGESIIDAASGLEQQSGSAAVFITLDGKGARRMSAGTRDNIGNRMAVVFIETQVETKMVDGVAKKERSEKAEVINVAVIRDQLGKRFQVTGLDSTDEARDLALLLRAGALAVPMEIVEERTVGPSLGQDNIDRGMMSVLIGLVLVLVFMALYYRVFGLIADLALVLNIVLLVALLSLLQATLTLPGIAGIVLTVGMAVDANVLIFERIREEIKAGNTPQASIHSGYEKAFSTIADANITTFIAAVLLFAFGTGPIKGFAVTLSLGILTSMFTAILGTRVVVNALYGRRRIKKLSL
jgi:preprotein translocase subunit SecD